MVSRRRRRAAPDAIDATRFEGPGRSPRRQPYERGVERPEVDARALRPVLRVRVLPFTVRQSRPTEPRPLGQLRVHQLVEIISMCRGELASNLSLLALHGLLLQSLLGRRELALDREEARFSS